MLSIFIYCRRHRVKIIHLNNDPYSNYAGLLAAWAMRIPSIICVRGLVYDSAFIRFLSRRPALFIVVSEYIRKNLIAIGVAGEKVRVIYDGYSPETLDPDVDTKAQEKEFALCPGERLVGITAMLTDWKGHKVLIRAMEGVFKEFPQCKLFIIGDTPTQDKSYLRELVSLTAELGLAGKTVFTGYRNDIPQLLKIMDVAVHASTSPDPLPGAVIQAMAMGRPVVAARCGGVPEIISDGENGILFEPNDVDGLRKAITNILRDKDKAQGMGRKARETFLERFTAKVMAENFTKDYEDLYSQYYGDIR